MKIEHDKILPYGNLGATLDIEGGRTWIFAQRGLASLELDINRLNYFEVGPKHGLHTLCINQYKPASITCVESPTKLKEERFNAWQKQLNTNFKIVHEDFNIYFDDKLYDLIFYTGVIYHNINQISQLKKLHSLASEDAYMIFESATSRNEKIKEENMIEVFHPPYSNQYRDVKTISFLPTKLACKSMLELSGWEIISTCEDYEDLELVDRINILCKKNNSLKSLHA